MAKRLKRKTLVGLLVVSSVLATAGILGVVDGKTGAVSKIFEDENVAEYSYTYNELLTAELTDDSSLTQKIDLSDDESSPFKKVVYNFNLYGDEDAGIVAKDTARYAKNCSKLEMRFTLKDDADFYISNLETEIDYYDSGFNKLDNHTDGINVNVRFGTHKFVTYDNQSVIYAFSQNAYSSDFVITITNDKARENEDSLFIIPTIVFNTGELSAWAPGH